MSRPPGRAVQLGAVYAFIAGDDTAASDALAEWCRPEIVLTGGKLKEWHVRGNRVRTRESVSPSWLPRRKPRI